MRFSISYLLITIVMCGCGKGPPSGPPVTWIDDSDPKMKAAIEKAQATLPEFVAALQSPKSSQTGFSIKTPITDGKNTEHMWLNPVSFDGKKYHGTINNQPEKVTGVKRVASRSARNYAAIS
jgi:uncharacterized protein YegJ (DUF2314 family)